MRLQPGPMVKALLLAGAVGCSSGRSRAAVDAGADAAPDSASVADAASAADAAPDHSVPDLGEPPDSRPARTGIPLPAEVAPPRLLIGGAAKLLGDWMTSCSHQQPPSGDGDRWCVFALPSADGKATSLWVIDVTAASRGEVPVCDGTSPRCLQLTSNLWVAGAVVGATYPYSDQFDGDTLIYYADAVSGPNESFKGPIHAWRPGWTSGRVISSSTGFLCFGHRQAPVATCVDDMVGDPMKPDSVRLSAGRLDDTTSGPLPVVGTVHPILSNGAFVFQLGFDRSGAHFAYSSGDPDPAVGSLHTIAVGQVGMTEPTVAVTDVIGWEVAHDDRKVYVLRGQREDAAFLTADFPAGGGEVPIESHVGDFLLLGDTAVDRGVIYLSDLGHDRGALHLLRDRSMPATALTVFTYSGVLEGVHVSPDLRFTAWLDEGFTGRVVPHDGSDPCVLNATRGADVFEPLFLDDAGLVFWNEAQADSDRRDGFFGPPDRCKERVKFSEGIDLYFPIGNRGLVFTDEKEGLDDGVTLKYAKIDHGKDWPAQGAVRVAEHTRSPPTLVGADPLLLVFEKTNEPGIFVFGPVPF
jgi:hypothetical protein